MTIFYATILYDTSKIVVYLSINEELAMGRWDNLKLTHNNYLWSLRNAITFAISSGLESPAKDILVPGINLLGLFKK